MLDYVILGLFSLGATLSVYNTQLSSCNYIIDEFFKGEMTTEKAVQDLKKLRRIPFNRKTIDEYLGNIHMYNKLPKNQKIEFLEAFRSNLDQHSD